MKKSLYIVLVILVAALGVAVVYSGIQETSPDTPAVVAEKSDMSALNSCLAELQFLQLGEDPEGWEYQLLEKLEELLQRGACPTAETRTLLPLNETLRTRIVEMMEKHGHYILAGEAPCNACCSPE